MNTISKIAIATGVIAADALRDTVGLFVPMGMAVKTITEKKPIKGVLWTAGAIVTTAWILRDNISGEARQRCTNAICKLTGTSLDPDVSNE